MQNKFIKALITIAFFSIIAGGESLFADSKNILYSQTFDSLQLQQMDISLTYENLKIQQIYGDEVVVEIGSNNNKRLPEVRLEADQQDLVSCLKILSTVKRASPGDNCTVYLYIPKDFLAKEISIKMLSGNLQTQALVAENQIELNSVSGRLDLAGCSSDFVKISTVSGNLTLQKLAADYFDISSVSGNIFVELEKAFLAKSSITSISGKVQFYYKKNESPFNDDSPDFIISSLSGKVESVPFD